MGLLLGLAVVLVFSHTASFEFVDYDDNVYVTENPRVRGGPTPENLIWALFDVRMYWHPLTWLSLMLDARIGGLDPAVFHITSLLLHLANTWLVYLVLGRMTGAFGRSAFVAALFGVHPLHVESVAWIAERKDVLSAFFWLLALLAYARHAEAPSRGRLALVAAAFILGLMSKPMVVSLPIVLLLLDYWPLGRLRIGDARSASGRTRITALLLEKAPLFSLSIAIAGFAILAQARAGAMGTFERYPLWARAGNAVVSLATYLAMTVWPRGLAILYPHPGTALGAIALVGSALLLLAISALSFRLARRAPYVLVGWLWFLVAIAPTLGLVQVGVQGMADRYTYLPLIGVFLAVVWGAADLAGLGAAPATGRGVERTPAPGGRAERGPLPELRRLLLGAAGVAVVIALGIAARAQTRYWSDSITLFRRSVAVTSPNKFALLNLGRALFTAGQAPEAAARFEQALSIDPGYTDARLNLAAALTDMGRLDEAATHCERALEGNPLSVAALINLGRVRLEQNRLGEAEQALARAVALAPGDLLARNNLGACLARQGRLEEAVREFTEVLRIDPFREGARENLDLARSMMEKRRTEQRAPSRAFPTAPAH
jgi:tetratricopeptide (TPR) repeat protein